MIKKYKNKLNGIIEIDGVSTTWEKLTNIQIKKILDISDDLRYIKLINRDLSTLSLKDKNLSNCLIQNSIFINSDFSNSDLSNANIVFSNFANSKIKNVNFNKVDIEYSDFSNSDLSNSNFKNGSIFASNFSYSNMKNCNIENTIIGDVDNDLTQKKIIKIKRLLETSNYNEIENNASYGKYDFTLDEFNEFIKRLHLGII